MARTIDDDDIEVGPDEVVVERKIVPQRQHFSLLALLVLLAFALTCAVVFYSGVPESPPPAPGTQSQTQPATAP